MTLQVGANGYYAVLLYNRRNLNREQLSDVFKKYGTLRSMNFAKDNLVFGHYKEYAEAWACLEALKNDPAFSAKPAKTKETNMKLLSLGNKMPIMNVDARLPRQDDRHVSFRFMDGPRARGHRSKSVPSGKGGIPTPKNHYPCTDVESEGSDSEERTRSKPTAPLKSALKNRLHAESSSENTIPSESHAQNRNEDVMTSNDIPVSNDKSKTKLPPSNNCEDQSGSAIEKPLAIQQRGRSGCRGKHRYREGGYNRFYNGLRGPERRTDGTKNLLTDDTKPNYVSIQEGNTTKGSNQSRTDSSGKQNNVVQDEPHNNFRKDYNQGERYTNSTDSSPSSYKEFSPSSKGAFVKRRYNVPYNELQVNQDRFIQRLDSSPVLPSSSKEEIPESPENVHHIPHYKSSPKGSPNVRSGGGQRSTPPRAPRALNDNDDNLPDNGLTLVPVVDIQWHKRAQFQQLLTPVRVVIGNLPLRYVMGDVFSLCSMYMKGKIVHVDMDYSHDPSNPPSAVVYCSSDVDADSLAKNLNKNFLDEKVLFCEVLDKFLDLKL